jgi:hypothetical protein
MKRQYKALMLYKAENPRGELEKEKDSREVKKLALTRDFKETIKKRGDCDPDFAKALLHEAIDLMLDGDSVTAKLVLRDLVNANCGIRTIGGRSTEAE